MSSSANEKPMDARIWFGLTKQPFSDDIKAKDLFLRQCLIDMNDRVQFAIRSGFYFTIVGEVGAGKSSALRYVASQIPPKQVHIINLTGGSWSFSELLRQTMTALGGTLRTSQQTTMLKTIYEGYVNIRESGKTPVLFIDEAHLFPGEVFSQIHLLSQPDMSSGRIVPIVMCGQTLLLERIMGQFNKPLASRVLDGYMLKGMTMDESVHYIRHHLITLAGASADIMDDNVMQMIHQSAVGIPRAINSICLTAMRDAMSKGQKTVSVDNIRVANRKWWEV